MDVLAELIGESPSIETVRENIRRLVARQHGGRRLPSILIQGETGTGKGLVARLLHRAGPRRTCAFVDVNCAAIPETLLEAELFGFERGAFTDARRAKPGLFQTAHHGTIFLDEIGLLPEPLQAKLLKVIEEQAVRRLGSTTSEPVDVWIVSATNADLQVSMRERSFREDLYHRLAVVTLRLPPLRERGADILLLAERLLTQTCEEYGLPTKTLAADAHARLLEYAWPGNVRELSNVIERVALLAEGQTVTGDLLGLLRSEPAHARAQPGRVMPPSGVSLDEAMRTHVLAVLEQTGWNISRSAALLGISRNTLRARIERLGLRSDSPPPLPPRRAERRVAAPPAAPPPTLAASAAPAPIRWERRRVTFLRAALAMLEGGDPLSDASRALEVLIDKVRNFGGRVEELSPSGMSASFGLDAIEDATRRAAHAAMAIGKAAERARRSPGQGFAVRTAIHVEQVLVGQSGSGAEIDADAKRAQWAALDALLLAGDADAISVSDAAARFLERRFDLTPLPHQDGAPGPVYQLAGRERAGLGLWGGMARFVGRRRELEVLHSRLPLVLLGHGQVLALVGEPGVGKSRLVWEITHSPAALGWLVLETGAASYATSTPYFPMIELLRTYFQIDGADDGRRIREKVAARIAALDDALLPMLPALLALLDAPVDDPHWQGLEPAQRRQRTLEAIKRLLLRESRVQPVLLVCEDLHWVDAETQAALDVLAQSLPASSVLLCVTYRPEYGHSWGSKSFYTQVRVDPLPRDSAEELFHVLLGDDVGLRPLEPLLIEWTEGNPFFLEETIRTLVETRALVGERGAYRLVKPVPTIQVPATVEQVLAGRIDRLAPEDKHLLQSAAVIGPDVSFALLQAIADAPEDSLRRALTRLQAAEFLYEAGALPRVAYTFKHALTHEVAYGTLLPEQRRGLHARITEALGGLYPDRLAEYIDQLAEHACRGELWDRALRYLRQAGSKALGRSASREAATRFGQALGVLTRLPESRETLEQAIDVRFDLRTALTPPGEHEQIFQYLLEADSLAQTLGDLHRLGRVSAYMVDYLRLMGEHDRALESGERAASIALETRDLGLQVLSNTYLGQVHHHRGDFRRGAELLRKNVAALEGALLREGFGLPQTPSVHSRTWLVLCLMEIGEFSEAAVLAAESLRIAETIEHPLSIIAACAGVGGLYLHQGDLGTGIPALERGLELSRAWDTWLWFPWLATCLGSAYALQMRVEEALPLLEQAVERATRMKRTGGHAGRLVALSKAYALGQRLGDAVELGRRALELARQHHERANEASALRLLAEVAFRADPPDLERAQGYARQALALAEELGMRPLAAHCEHVLGQVHGRAGNPAAAERHLAAAVALYREMDMRFWLVESEAALREWGGGAISKG